jgi:hypothetical protein
MRRDLSLMRDIMRVLETSPAVAPPTNWREQLASLGWEDAQMVVEHCGLLIESGFLVGHVDRDSFNRRPHVYISRVTHAGHEFLDAARSDVAWKAAMEKIDAVGGAVPLTVLTELLVRTSRELLGLHED